MRVFTSSAVIVGLFFFSSMSFAVDPDCAGINGWATNMSFAYLKNSGITDNDALDFTKTSIVTLASKKVDDSLYRQVYLIRFTDKSGRIIEVIAIHDASDDECSMSDVEVFVLSKQISAAHDAGGVGCSGCECK